MDKTTSSLGFLLLFTLVSCVQIEGSIFLGPLHASCKVDWTIGLTCDECSTKIKAQMLAWEGDNCNGSEKCLYKFESFDGKTMKGTHTTPVKHYVDDLTFKFEPHGNSCNVNGYSTSETWYAILDYGTNYCNLHNLITGSGLDKANPFQESTSNSDCTQYSSANCDKY